MNEHTAARLDTLTQQMQAAGIDLLVCRLPEHILYLTGFWPHSGFNWALLTAGGRTALVAPPDEDVPAGVRAEAVERYDVMSLAALLPVREAALPALTAAARQLAAAPRRVAWEEGFELIGVSPWQGEVRPPAPDTPWLLRRACPGAELVDGAPLLRAARAIKTPWEVAQIRRACTIGLKGLAAARAALHPGLREVDLASVVEATIRRAGTGYAGACQVRGFAQVMSGPRSATAAPRAFNSTTDRPMAAGELVVIELFVYADGYCADLTRAFVVGGRPDDRQLAVYRALREAQAAAFAALRPGAPRAAPYHAALAVLDRHGLAPYWPHHLGHSVGLQYHEGPMLHPGAPGEVQAGEVYTVEPGVYIPGWGGLRLEDVVAVTASGVDVLSPLELPLANP